MGSFDMLVAVAKDLGCCDTAVAVDRLLRPYLRWPRMWGDENADYKMERYRIIEGEPVEKPPPVGFHAFINAGGHWQGQLHPDWTRRDDPEAEPVWTPIEEWHEEVREWAEQCLAANFRLIPVFCHD